MSHALAAKMPAIAM